jgi:hypothetical protein
MRQGQIQRGRPLAALIDVLTQQAPCRPPEAQELGVGHPSAVAQLIVEVK